MSSYSCYKAAVAAGLSPAATAEAGVVSRVTSTFKRSLGAPTDAGAKLIVPYAPLLRKEGLSAVVECTI